MVICPRCGTKQLQDIRTWTYIKEAKRHLCPVCVLQGAEGEDPKSWENTEKQECK